jgi:hypothetical protein
MNIHHKHNLTVLYLCLGLFLGLSLLPFGILGQDGYSLWYPIVAEYLRGAVAYNNSSVIFGGQNLAAVYGELPFWKVFRLFNPSIEFFLNGTLAVYMSLFFLLSVSIARGVKKTLKTPDLIFLFLFSVFSPVVVNRVMVGHFNLLFGVLPFFALLSLFFNKSFASCLLYIFCIWCALSTQAFQILAYHIFYIPILVYFLVKTEKNKSKYAVTAAAIFLAAFILNLPNFLKMYAHATSADNARSLGGNVVYSYLTSTVTDLSQFFFSGIYLNFLNRDYAFFHEINYPIGAFIILFCFSNIDRHFKFLIAVLLTCTYLFCMNIFPFNLLSDLVFIKPFRVPQRIFMVLALFCPLWVFLKSKVVFQKSDWLILLGLMLVAQFISYFEIFALAAVIVIICNEKKLPQRFALIFAFAGLFTGAWEKLRPSIYAHEEYVAIKESLKPLTNRFDSRALSERIFHFETDQPMQVNYVAQSMGIRTVEGYGHPSAHLLKKFEALTNTKTMATDNSMYLPNGVSNSFYKEFGINTLVKFDEKNQLFAQDIK